MNNLEQMGLSSSTLGIIIIGADYTSPLETIFSGGGLSVRVIYMRTGYILTIKVPNVYDPITPNGLFSCTIKTKKMLKRYSIAGSRCLKK